MKITRENKEKVEATFSGEIYSIRPYDDKQEVVLMKLENGDYVVLNNESYSDDRLGDIWPEENIALEYLKPFFGRLVFEA